MTVKIGKWIVAVTKHNNKKLIKRDVLEQKALIVSLVPGFSLCANENRNRRKAGQGLETRLAMSNSEGSSYPTCN